MLYVKKINTQYITLLGHDPILLPLLIQPSLFLERVGTRADLHFINLKGINMKKAIFAFANMQQSNLVGVNLQQAK